jgi:hypothetical protein
MLDVCKYLQFCSISLPNGVTKDKHSSLFNHTVSDNEKSLIKLTPGANVIKLFCP